MRTNVPTPPLPPVLTPEGTRAQRISNLQALQRAMASCFLWEDQFYESGVAIADRIRELTLAVTPGEAANVALEARRVYKLRHAPLWVARTLAGGNAEQRAMVAGLLPEIIRRPDELTEFLALYWKNGKQPLAAGVKKGLARAFTRFSAHALAKYNQDNAIKLRDVLFLVHAKPVDDEQAMVWKQLVDSTLPTPDTWETQLSAGADKKATWERLLDENKLGALALLRNLRNMKQVGVSQAAIILGLAQMNTEYVLPFRFITAARFAPELEPYLEKAMFRCVAAMPKLPGRTAVVIDTSPSMWGSKVSTKSDMDRFDAAAALAVLIRETCDMARVYWFNQTAGEVPARRGFALRDVLAATKGDASRGGLAVEQANRDGYDRIIVLTDGAWHPSDPGHGWERPAIESIPEPLPSTTAYLINVAANRNSVGSGKWEYLEGWSEGVVSYIQATEGLEVGVPLG